MKKTIISLLLALLLLASCDPEMKHEHSWAEWTVSKAATCTEDGTAVRKCTVCGEEDEETRALKAPGHSLSKEGTVIKKADCGNEGEETFSCTREGCSYKETRVLPATGEHTGGEEQTTEATCTEAGKTYKICSVCNKEYDVTITENAKGHTWGEWTVKTAGTCSTEAVETRSCSDCGKTEEKTGSKDSENHPADKLTWNTISFLTKTGKTGHCGACGADIQREEDYDSVEGYWVSDIYERTDEEGDKHKLCFCISMDNDGNASMEGFTEIYGKLIEMYPGDCTYEWVYGDASDTSLRTGLTIHYNESVFQTFGVTEDNSDGICKVMVQYVAEGSEAISYTLTRKSTDHHVEHSFSGNVEPFNESNHSRKTLCDSSIHDTFYTVEQHTFNSGRKCTACGYFKPYNVVLHVYIGEGESATRAEDSPYTAHKIDAGTPFYPTETYEFTDSGEKVTITGITKWVTKDTNNVEKEYTVSDSTPITMEDNMSVFIYCAKQTT